MQTALLQPGGNPVSIGGGPPVAIWGADPLGVVRVYHGGVAMPTRVWGLQLNHPLHPPISANASVAVTGTPYRLYCPPFLTRGEAVLLAYFDEENRLMDANTPEVPLPWAAISEGASGEGCGKDVAVAALVCAVLAAAVVGGFLWLMG